MSIESEERMELLKEREQLLQKNGEILRRYSTGKLLTDKDLEILNINNEGGLEIIKREKEIQQQQLWPQQPEGKEGVL